MYICFSLNFNEAKQMEDGKTATENALYTMTEFRDFLNSIKPELELTKVENIAHQFFDMFEVVSKFNYPIKSCIVISVGVIFL